MSDILAQSFGNVLVPDGIYTGTITGKNVTFFRDNQKYIFETIKTTAERGAKVRIVVTMMKGNVYKL